MAYTLWAKALPEKSVITTETHHDLGEALESAKFAGFGGPRSVEISITDEDGVEHFNMIHTA